MNARWLVGLVVALATLATLPARVAATCCPIPCTDCWIRWSGQLNLVVMDRAAGEVRLVPNIRFAGMSPDFALVVPTPSLPAFELGPETIWTEALEATKPAAAQDSNNDLFGCNRNNAIFFESPRPADAGGVVIHAERTVGAMHATVISSDDPTALVRWLAEHGFALTDADAARFAPYVARDWFFTTMRPDTTDAANRMPPGGWNANVPPVVVRFAAQQFELPLPLLAIGAQPLTQLVFFVVDDHRMALPGFATFYANRISRSELSAMRRTYPALAQFLGEGRFLTRLDRTFRDPSEMETAIVLERAPTDDELRRTRFPFVGAVPLALVVALLCGRAVVRRRAHV